MPDAYVLITGGQSKEINMTRTEYILNWARSCMRELENRFVQMLNSQRMTIKNSYADRKVRKAEEKNRIYFAQWI